MTTEDKWIGVDTVRRTKRIVAPPNSVVHTVVQHSYPSYEEMMDYRNWCSANVGDSLFSIDSNSWVFYFKSSIDAVAFKLRFGLPT